MQATAEEMTTLPATPLLNGIYPLSNAYVLPEHKIVYVSVTKAASTSIKWMVADLAGEDLPSFYNAIGAHQTRLMTIHRERSHWQRARELSSLSDDELAGISRDLGWFVFAVVRSPWSRLWSSWQSKMLVRQHWYTERYGDESWFPRVPSSTESVIEDFHRFARAKPWTTDPILSTDAHFRPQVAALRPRTVNYSKVYDVSDMPKLIDDLHTHLRSVGKDQQLYLPRANDAPLGLIDGVIDGVAQEIRAAYHKDFAAFPHWWRREDLKTEPPWSQDRIELAAFHTVANERIGDMREEALRLRQASKHPHVPPLRSIPGRAVRKFARTARHRLTAKA